MAPIAFGMSIALLSSSCDEQAAIADDVRPSLWEIDSKIDPLTDQTVITAQARFDADPFYVNTVISCRAGSKLQYRFLAYSNDHKPADIKIARFTQSFMPVYAYRFRLDEADAVRGTTQGTRYSNELTFRTDYGQAASQAQGPPVSALNS